MNSSSNSLEAVTWFSIFLQEILKTLSFHVIEEVCFTFFKPKTYFISRNGCNKSFLKKLICETGQLMMKMKMKKWMIKNFVFWYLSLSTILEKIPHVRCFLLECIKLHCFSVDCLYLCIAKILNIINKKYYKNI